MFTRAKLLREVLPVVLAATLLTVGSPSASASVPVDGYYGCNSGAYVSSGWSSGSYQISSGSVSVSSGTGCSGAVVIAAGVTGIGNSAFQASSLTSITIPNSVTSIGDYAFFTATALTSVTIPNSVTSIGVGAFSNAFSLTSVTIGNSVTSIGDFAFSNATALTSVTIPNSVTSIGMFAFNNATALTSLTISDSVTSIGNFAFNNATALTSLTISDSVTSIGNFAFNNATALTSLTISDSVTSIGSFAFGNTTALTQYTYCGTNLTQVDLDTARLNGKTKLCTPTVIISPMLPSVAPTISINDGVITCTAGEYSRAATSVAFSLFVDGNHVATNFSSAGDFLPSWLAPWASAATVQRSASLQSASWNLDIAGDASRASCWTLAYSNNATGLISSDQISLR